MSWGLGGYTNSTESIDQLLSHRIPNQALGLSVPRTQPKNNDHFPQILHVDAAAASEADRPSSTTSTTSSTGSGCLSIGVSESIYE